jgi:PAS domain S-box-containing protein
MGGNINNTRIMGVTSADGSTIDLVNPAFAEMHGRTIEELTGKPLSEIYAPEAENGVMEIMNKAVEKGYHVQESIHLRKDGSRFSVLVNVTTVKGGSGTILYRIANVQDITEQKKAEEALRFRTYYDLLTGLPNRTELMLRLDMELSEAEKTQRKLAVLHIDLDRLGCQRLWDTRRRQGHPGRD